MSRGEQVVDIDEVTSVLGMNNIIRFLFGKCAFGENIKNKTAVEEAKKFSELLERLSNARPMMGDSIPFLHILDKANIREVEYVTSELDRILDIVLEEHRLKVGNSQLQDESGDFVDAMLQMQRDENGGHPSDPVLRALLKDLIFAGTDSSRSSLSWILIELMRHPEARHKLQSELDTVVGRNRLVQESDLDDLMYLQAVLKESLRLHPITPLLPIREALVDTTVAGYYIPKKTQLTVNQYAISRDPSVWENPLVFDPDRFLNSSVDVKGNDFHILPFGSGRRICVGMRLGLITLGLNVGQLIHCCDFSLPQGMRPEDIDVQEAFGVVLTNVTPLKIIAKPRLPSGVYMEANVAI